MLKKVSVRHKIYLKQSITFWCILKGNKTEKFLKKEMEIKCKSEGNKRICLDFYGRKLSQNYLYCKPV